MLEKFERYPLMFGPTPIEKLNRMGEARMQGIWILLGLGVSCDTKC